MPQTRSFTVPGGGEEGSVGSAIGSYYGVVSCSRLHSSAAAGEPSRAAAAGGGEAPMADTWSVPPTHSTFFGAKLTLGPAAPSLTASTAPRPYSRGAAIASLLLLIGAACAWRIPEVQPAAASR